MRRLRPLGIGAAILFAAWLAGFAAFALDAGIGRPRGVREAPWPARADGIVALTGGALRVETALALLHAGVADRLLISGVPPGIRLPAIMESRTGARIDPRPLLRLVADLRPTSRITLGHGASSTIGNAAETAAWARANDLHRIVVVTAAYHMRRALAELGAALPDATFVPFPVYPPGTGLRVLLAEYDKYLLAIGGVLPRPGPTDLA